MKLMTTGEAETKRRKAVEFLRRIGNDDLADQFESMSPEEYAEHKGVQLMQNPIRKRTMATNNKSKTDLQAELDDANDYIDELEGKLNDIVGIASDDSDDDDSDNDDDQDDDSDSDDGEDDDSD